MKKLKLAACGINCNECGHYKITMEYDLKAAESLIEYFKSEGWIKENDGAESILKKVPLCRGCWDTTDVHTQYCADCVLRACSKEKHINHCGECSDFPCEPYNEFVRELNHHQKAMEYLLSLREAYKGDCL